MSRPSVSKAESHNREFCNSLHQSICGCWLTNTSFWRRRALRRHRIRCINQHRALSLASLGARQLLPPHTVRSTVPLDGLTPSLYSRFHSIRPYLFYSLWRVLNNNIVIMWVKEQKSPWRPISPSPVAHGHKIFLTNAPAAISASNHFGCVRSRTEVPGLSSSALMRLSNHSKIVGTSIYIVALPQ